MMLPFHTMGRASLQAHTCYPCCRSCAMGLPPAPSTSAVIPSSPGALPLAALRMRSSTSSTVGDAQARLSACGTLPVSRQLNAGGDLLLESCLVLKSPLLSCLVCCSRPLTTVQLDARGELFSVVSSTASKSVHLVNVAIIRCLSRTIQFFLQVFPFVAAATNRSLSGQGAPRHLTSAARCWSRLSLSHAILFILRKRLTQSTRVQVRNVSQYLLGPCFFDTRNVSAGDPGLHACTQRDVHQHGCQLFPREFPPGPAERLFCTLGFASSRCSVLLCDAGCQFGKRQPPQHHGRHALSPHHVHSQPNICEVGVLGQSGTLCWARGFAQCIVSLGIVDGPEEGVRSVGSHA